MAQTVRQAGTPQEPLRGGIGAHPKRSARETRGRALGARRPAAGDLGLRHRQVPDRCEQYIVRFVGGVSVPYSLSTSKSKRRRR